MKPLPIALAAVLVLTGAAVHGAATYRWDALAPAAGRADALHALAVETGDYQSQEIPSEIEIKEKSRVTCRRYSSPSANAGAVISITSGPPGAVATHTPDVCYPSSGYKTLSAPKKETVDLPGGGKATYFVAEFEKKSASKVDRQKVRWAWAAPNGSWDAPEYPRFSWSYMNQSELFKLYVVTAVPADEAGRSVEDPVAVRQFVTAAFAQYAGLLVAR